MHRLFTEYPQDLRKVINNPPSMDYVHIWHRYGEEAQKHQAQWLEHAKATNETTPLGTVALEFARLARQGFTMAECLDRMLGELEFGRVDGPPARETPLVQGRHSQASSTASGGSNSKPRGQQKPKRSRPKQPRAMARGRKESQRDLQAQLRL